MTLRFQRFNEKSYVHVVRANGRILAIHATRGGAENSSDAEKKLLPVSRWHWVTITKKEVKS